ncbi:MAG: alpha/beta fold hydrolase [Desulfurococcales archaeon]|nr:alpha/beta fold hydrolase [Desulfurococcales archaeon]
MELSNLIKEILELVNLDIYGVAGVVKDEKLIISALREGAANIYLYEHGKDLVKLNKLPISGVAEPPYGSDRVVIYRDVAKGRELHKAYLVHINRPGEEVELSSNLQPMRYFSVIDKGENVFITGVTERGLTVHKIKPQGEVDIVGTIPGLGFLVDVNDGLGAGILFQQTGRIKLFTMNIDSGELKIHNLPGSVASARVGGDKKILLALEGREGVTFHTYDPESKELGPLQLPYNDLERYNPAGVNYMSLLPDNRILVVARKHGRSKVFLDGRLIEGPDGNYGAGFKWRNGLVVSHTSLLTPYRVLYLGENGWEELVGPKMPDWLRNTLGDHGFHKVKSFDGEEVPVFTLESTRAGKPGPTVVLVHGGPFSEDLDAWNIFATALALTGYNVVMPNYRGSTGYGEEWRNKLIGDPCGAELEDIVSAARWAKEDGLAEYNVIMGYSYGGYATMCALTRKPGEFKAGVAGASVVDWEEMYELSDPAFKQFIELVFGGSREKWRERSPIHYVENLRDPLCIIHPQNDSRTPLKPVLRFMEKAVELGKTFEAHIAPDMGHAVNTVDDVVKILLPAVIFLYRLRRDQAASS